MYFGISFKRPDLQEMSVEQRMKEYKKVTEKVTEKEGLVLDLIEKNNNVTIGEIVENMHISRKSINAYNKTIKRERFTQKNWPGQRRALGGDLVYDMGRFATLNSKGVIYPGIIIEEWRK